MPAAQAQGGGIITRTLPSVGASTTFETAHPYADHVPLTTWDVTAAAGAVVELEFTQFAVEGCCDPVTVSESSNGADWTVLGTFYGAGPTYNLVTSGRYLRVTFSSDGSVTANGWTAVATAKRPTTCGAFYTSDTLAGPTAGSTRLVNGASSAASGAVEAFLNGEWQPVCDDSWDAADMQVVCRNIGCAGVSSSTLTWEGSAPTQPGGTYGVTSVSCDGTEASLDDCSINVGSYSCTNQAAGRCSDCAACGVVAPPLSGHTEAPPPTNCLTDGSIRLAPNSLTTGASGSGVSGRLELYDGSVGWGAVCDDGWGTINTNVVCEQLGCGTSGNSYTNMDDGNGPGFFTADDVACSGHEDYLSSCSYSTTHNCAVSESVVVTCGGCSLAEPEEVTSTHGDCSLPPASGPGTLGTDTSISTPCTGAIRLAPDTLETASGEESVSGRLEYYSESGQYGSVCDDGWTDAATSVTCRQLGCSPTGSMTSGQSPSGSSGGNVPSLIALDDVSCTGTEAHLAECSASTAHNCQHSEDVWLTCAGCDASSPGLGDAHGECGLGVDTSGAGCDGAIRLGPGSLVAGEDGTSVTGRLELMTPELQWGTVCDDLFSTAAADVACAQLGCASSANSFSSGETSGRPNLIAGDDFQCNGSESYLSDCTHLGADEHNCSPSEDVLLTCRGCDAGSPGLTSPHGSCSLATEECSGSIRLAASTLTTSADGQVTGRMEIFEGEWGTVCDDSFSDTNAAVACGQLGCDGSSGTYQSGLFGEDESSLPPILADDMECRSSDSQISDCDYSTSHNCSPSENVWLTCYGCSVAATADLSSPHGTCSSDAGVIVAAVLGPLAFCCCVAFLCFKANSNKPAAGGGGGGGGAGADGPAQRAAAQARVAAQQRAAQEAAQRQAQAAAQQQAQAAARAQAEAQAAAQAQMQAAAASQAAYPMAANPTYGYAGGASAPGAYGYAGGVPGGAYGGGAVPAGAAPYAGYPSAAGPGYPGGDGYPGAGGAPYPMGGGAAPYPTGAAPYPTAGPASPYPPAASAPASPYGGYGAASYGASALPPPSSFDTRASAGAGAGAPSGGTLKLEILGAEGVKAGNNPKAKFILGGTPYETPMCPGGQLTNPVWPDASFDVPVTGDQVASESVAVTVRASNDEAMAAATFPLSQFAGGSRVDTWVECGLDGKPQGRLHIRARITEAVTTATI